MAQDQWEPDDEQDDNDEEQKDEITPEERQALEQIRRSGLSPRELLQRAGRDIERERSAGQPAQRPQDAVPDDPNAVLTKADAARLIETATAQARTAATAEMTRASYEKLIADTATEAMGEALSDRRMKFLRQAVAEAVQRPGIERMTQAEFSALLAETTRTIVHEEWGAGGPVKDAARARKAKGEGGNAPRGAIRETVDEDGDEAPLIFGLTAPPFPTDAEIAAQAQRDLDRAVKAIKAGRL